jgi:prophage regulatory protein
MSRQIQVLRLPAVISKTGIGRSTIYTKIAENNFPKPVHLGSRSVGWIEAEVDAWLSDKVRLKNNSAGDER